MVLWFDGFGSAGVFEVVEHFKKSGVEGENRIRKISLFRVFPYSTR